MLLTEQASIEPWNQLPKCQAKGDSKETAMAFPK
jgi:hypothetical protein